MSGNLEVFITILAHIINMDSADEEACANYLLEDYINRNDEEGNNLTYLAAISKSDAILDFLIDSSGWAEFASVFFKDGSALIHLIKRKKIDILNKMITQFDRPCLASVDGVKPVHVAAELNLPDVLELLYTYPYKNWYFEPDVVMFNDESSERMKPIDYAVRAGALQSTEYILKNAPGQFEPDLYDRNVFLNAVYGGNVKCAKLLLDWYKKLGIEKDVFAPDNKGNTPMHYAVRGNSIEMVQFLLENKAPVNKMEEEEKLIPLALAAKLGKDE